MMGLISELWKSTQVEALSLIDKLKYIILKKADTDNYLVTSADHYESAKTFFSKN